MNLDKNLLTFLLIGAAIYVVYTMGKKTNTATYDVESLVLTPTGSRKSYTETDPGQSFEHRYQNAETWDITWNAEGLPEKITIHRDAIQR